MKDLIEKNKVKGLIMKMASTAIELKKQKERSPLVSPRDGQDDNAKFF